jgi:glycosyltransferase involved in cell wall biosynthesis
VLQNLLKEWGGNPRGHRFVLCFKDAIPDADFLNSPAFEKKRILASRCLNRGRLWEQIHLPRFIAADRIDAFFSPAYIIPLRAPCPTVVIVHDISYQTHPEWFSPRQRLLWQWLTRKTVRQAAKIICCSNFTRREALDRYGKNLEGKTTTVYWAAEERFKPGDKTAAARHLGDKYRIAGPFFLFVGRLFRRRNISLLIRAFQAVSRRRPDYRLVLIGSESGESEREARSLRDILGEPESRDKIFRFDYVEEQDLIAFYRAASCLVYPSIYEGFGFPIIEAMACGVPVIIAKAQSMEEVAAGAARIVDPLDENHLARAMIELIDNPGERDGWVRKGLERAGQLSWRATAAAILDAIEDAAGKNR